MGVKPVAMFGESRRSSAAGALAPHLQFPTRRSRRRVYCCGIGASCTFIASATEV
jgi:hypothetical protein